MDCPQKTLLCSLWSPVLELSGWVEDFLEGVSEDFAGLLTVISPGAVWLGGGFSGRGFRRLCRGPRGLQSWSCLNGFQKTLLCSSWSPVLWLGGGFSGRGFRRLCCAPRGLQSWSCLSGWWAS